jgi:hypothetical protein
VQGARGAVGSPSELGPNGPAGVLAMNAATTPSANIHKLGRRPLRTAYALRLYKRGCDGRRRGTGIGGFLVADSVGCFLSKVLGVFGVYYIYIGNNTRAPMAMLPVQSRPIAVNGILFMCRKA